MTANVLKSLAAVALAAGLTACQTPNIPGTVKEPLTPTQRFVTPVTQTPQEIRLALHADGLSSKQVDALEDFADAWRERDSTDIVIRAPSAGADPAAAYRMSESTRSFLIDQGVPDDAISIEGYAPEGQGPQPLVVAYMRHTVEIPKCGQVWSAFTRTWKNDVQSNFGCAVTANMGAQIADPADLVHPRTMTPQDATRRQAVLDKYRKGEPTGAQQDEKAGGAISKAVQ